MGRLVLNVEPNTSANFSADPSSASTTKAWRYAYDFAGHLVGTSDARGCGMNLYYDQFNRITAEDWSPCKLNQASYSPPNSATGDGFEVLYRYDRPDSGQTSDFGVSESNLVGRLVSVQDRGAHTRWAYDARGRVTGIATRLARPVDAAGSWPQDPVHDRYTDDSIRSSIGYDADDRPVRASTGASASELMDPNGISELTLRYTARGTLKSSCGKLWRLAHRGLLRPNRTNPIVDVRRSRRHDSRVWLRLGRSSADPYYFACCPTALEHWRRRLRASHIGRAAHHPKGAGGFALQR